MSALEIRNLRKKFGGLLATQDVSFDVEEHSLTALIGFRKRSTMRAFS